MIHCGWRGPHWALSLWLGLGGGGQLQTLGILSLKNARWPVCGLLCLLVPEGSSEVSGEPPKIQRAIPKKERGNGSEDGSPPCLFASEIP